MSRDASPLSLFHPLVERWFTEHVGTPTDVQETAWPRIARGEHVLITAPTGSGKTLTAFLWALNRLITGDLATGHTTVLYVSPLKALNNDIQRNLLRPLKELEETFRAAAEPFPTIRVLTRSGDTPASDRQRMQRHPPEILITTPESLNLLLSSRGGRSMLTEIRTVILDEIHDVVGSKRGTHLITAVERLTLLSGEFQRISLSATVRPVETVAEFVGGYRIEDVGDDVRYVARPVAVVRSGATKRYNLKVHYPAEVADRDANQSIWEPLIEDFRRIVTGNRSTLLFCNSRRLCERITLLLNSVEEEPIAYAHHGSLSREVRAEVERKLKAGELKAIVATSSLEMGIDIGALDEVVLIQSPPEISSGIQRVGRAGHQVGEVSRGTLFPTHPRDFIEGAVLAKAALEGDIEATYPIRCPLDVLAQVLVSMVGVETWDADELYRVVCASYPYRYLSRVQFDAVLNMLAGRYDETRIRELSARVSIDRLDNTVATKPGAVQTLYLGGGTIPDRGYFQMKHHETGARIGELDEEFVWESSVGATFTFGTQHWRVEKITHNDVFVLPAGRRPTEAPFWKSEETNRDWHFSDRIGRFLETANDRLEDAGFVETLQSDYCMNDVAAGQLVGFLRSQRETTRCDLPHRHHLLVEFINAGPDQSPGTQAVLHTFWGGRVNRPFAMALASAWEERFLYRPEVYAENNCVVVMLNDDFDGAELLSMVTSATLEPLLRKRLEGSGFFGARFRECAGRALLVTRQRMGQRMPLWLNRLKSQKLLDAVMNYEDFPVLLETWRTCLQDEFDMEALRLLLAELESGAIRWSEVHTERASPFAQTLSWRQINDEYMYADDTPKGGKSSRLRDDLLRDLVFNAALRPTIPPELIARFEMKRQRLIVGYPPQAPRELTDWVKERLAIPQSEWRSLLDAIHRDGGSEPYATERSVAQRVARLVPVNAREPLVVAFESLPRVLAALGAEGRSAEVEPLPGGPSEPPRLSSATDEEPDEALATFLGEWLRFYGPRTPAFITSTLGVEPARARLSVEDLAEAQTVVWGKLVTDSDADVVCDAENFEILLRMARADAVPVFEPLEIEVLPLFVAHIQGLHKPENDYEGLNRRLEQLLCYPARAELWETEFLPTRVRSYITAWLDSLMQEGDLRWIGCEHRQIAFCPESELDLMRSDAPSVENEESSTDWESIFPDPEGRYDFSALLRASNWSLTALTGKLWDGVWKGEVTNDAFGTLRRGIESGFQAPEVKASSESFRSRLRRRVGGRLDFGRWKNAAPFGGNWLLLPKPSSDDDLLEIEERNKDRVRLLLDRYGMLFRELLQNELPVFRWGSIFRSLRLMELSGEVLAGCFFNDIPGPQFISHEAFRSLQRGLPKDAVYWMNATDPASLCGIGLDALRGSLPKRQSSNYVVFRGTNVVSVIQRNAKELVFRVPPEDAVFVRCVAPLRHLLTRAFQPMRRLDVETINGEPAGESPYVDALRGSFEVVVDYKTVVLYRSSRDVEVEYVR
jgi:ATP-dependent Lhr-like helicase